MKRLILIGSLLVGLVIALVYPQHHAFADELSDKQAEIEQLKAKLKDIQGQKQTLSKTIDYLNTKIVLTQKEISATQTEIAGLEEEVQALSGKIVILDANLEKLTTYWISRVQSMYIHTQSTQPMYLLLTSNGLQDFMMRYKYLRVSQRQDRMDMNTLESMKINFDSQKDQKEIKQADLEKAKKKLEGQKNSLNQQQAEKQNLLQVTRNDETKYQEMLAKARSDLAAMSQYVASQGGASLLNNQTKCNDWGCYYNQRDSQWGKMLIGDSDMTLAEVGCLITSTAMVTTHYGKSIKPSDIAGNSSVFFGGTAYMNQGCWSTNGATVCRTRICSGCSADVTKSKINSELADNHPVIVQMYGGKMQHFIVIKGRDGDSYTMHDPYMENGNDKPLSTKYSISDIVSVDSVRVN